MRKNSDTPQGYNYSSLGLIPEDWQLMRLGDVVDIMSGESPSLFDLAPIGSYPYIKVDDLNNCSKYQRRSREYAKIAVNAVKRGSTIFPKRGAAIMNNKVRLADCDILMDSNMMAIMPNTEYLDEEFLYYRIIYEKLYRIADTSTIPQINNKHIIPYKIPLPSLSEQKRIVNLLNTWDKAIEKQTELIEKLKLRKRGLMQQLLTGKKRLPGFTDKWKTVTIDSFAKEVSILNKDHSDYIVLSCTKYNGLVPSLDYFGKQIFAKDLSTYKIVPREHFVYATNHIEEGSIGYQSNYEFSLVSPMYTVFLTDKEKVDDTFIFALFKSQRLMFFYQSLIEGSINRRGGLRWNSFSRIKIDLPTLKEQEAITEFIKSINNEITLEERKLSSLQSQKRGLMQQLLTGKKRIKRPL